VTAGVRAAAVAIASTLVAATVAHAQGRYRVVVGAAGPAKPVVAEFRVCVPAETSDCGSWIVRGADVDDSSVITAPGVITQLQSPNGAHAIAIDGDAVVIRSLVTSAHPARNAIREKDFSPRAIAATVDSRYVFVVLESAHAASGVIDLIDLRSMAVIDTLALPVRPTSIAVLR
jgi:hypothetical protein